MNKYHQKNRALILNSINLPKSHILHPLSSSLDCYLPCIRLTIRLYTCTDTTKSTRTCCTMTLVGKISSWARIVTDSCNQFRYTVTNSRHRRLLSCNGNHEFVVGTGTRSCFAIHLSVTNHNTVRSRVLGCFTVNRCVDICTWRTKIRTLKKKV